MEASYQINDFKIEEFNFYDNSLIEDSIKLLNFNTLKKKHTKEYWFWRFQCNPFGKSYGWYAKLKKTGELAGILLWWPWNYSFEYRNFLFYQAINGVTNEKYRNSGIFFELNTRAINFFKTNNIPLIGFPNIRSYPSYKKLGWQTIANIHPFYIPISPFKTFAKIIHLRVKNTKNTLKCFNPTNFRFNEYDSKTAQTIWTPEILAWRFSSHPLYTYYSFNNQRCSVVFKLKERGRIIEAQVVLSTIASKDDFIEFRNFLYRKGIDVLSYYGSNTLLTSIIRKLYLKYKHKKSLFFVASVSNSLVDTPFKLELAELDTT